MNRYRLSYRDCSEIRERSRHIRRLLIAAGIVTVVIVASVIWVVIA